VKITLCPALRSPVELARAHRRTLAELLAASIAAVERPATYVDDPEPAPHIEGRPEYAPAPFHAWAWVPFAAGWELEWSVPALDVECGTLRAVDDVARARVAWQCADAHEVQDHDELAFDRDERECAPGDDDPAVVEDADAATVVHPCFALTIRARSVVLDVADELDVAGDLPDEIETLLVELVHDLTGFRIAVLEDTYDGEDVPLTTAVRFEAVCQACRPEPDDVLAPAESARRFAGALASGGALSLAHGAEDAAVVAAAARALADPAAPLRPRAERLATELLACAAVDELFADDDTLAAWLAAW
jgi:hypothetical protein